MTKHRTTFRRARQLVGLTQRAAAKIARISQTALSELETGTKRNPSWEVVGRLSILYHCSPFVLQPLRYKPKPAKPRLLLGIGKTEAD